MHMTLLHFIFGEYYSSYTTCGHLKSWNTQPDKAFLKKLLQFLKYAKSTKMDKHIHNCTLQFSDVLSDVLQNGLMVLYFKTDI